MPWNVGYEICTLGMRSDGCRVCTCSPFSFFVSEGDEGAGGVLACLRCALACTVALVCACLLPVALCATLWGLDAAGRGDAFTSARCFASLPSRMGSATSRPEAALPVRTGVVLQLACAGTRMSASCSMMPPMPMSMSSGPASRASLDGGTSHAVRTSPFPATCRAKASQCGELACGQTAYTKDRILRGGADAMPCPTP